MPKKIKIQKSEEADADEILRLQYAAYQSEAELNNNFNIQPLTQTLEICALQGRNYRIRDNFHFLGEKSR